MSAVATFFSCVLVITGLFLFVLLMGAFFPWSFFALILLGAAFGRHKR